METYLGPKNARKIALIDNYYDEMNSFIELEWVESGYYICNT